jgi:hypothetical protein
MSYTNGLDKPSDYFNTVLYTGNAGTLNVTGVGFSPSLVWIKGRGYADSQVLTDTVRSTTKCLSSDSTTAEFTQTNGLTAFGGDGFTLGNWSAINRASTTVAWNWKAGTSVSGNTTGSGTAKAYSGSVSTDAGFSIIGYVGNGTANHTLPHHLGVVPKMLIIKNRTSSGYEWSIYHHTLGNQKRMFLNDTSAVGSSNAYWNNTSPTSSVINLGGGGAVNENNSNMIAYCFAEKQGYSKFGSYIGNGDSDGTFVYTGFKPAFVIFKRSSGTGNWQLLDNKRLGYNVENHTIYPNSTIVEQDETDGDILSNGFKLRNTGTDGNGSGSTYIYMAFAENPFTTSSGVPATAR